MIQRVNRVRGDPAATFQKLGKFHLGVGLYVCGRRLFEMDPPAQEVHRVSL
jgi:hypothetical protein